MAQIQRLPSDVAAQIKASASLSSLNDIVIGLLENALDAEAERIDIKVDFARASCWIHDDGTGIHPSNFEESGGLGKPFHTSNIPGSYDLQASKGLLLSSVAAVAVLSITSRYDGFDDANALILHFSQPATRLLPAPEHMALELGDHGTKVSVHDLFGNMAVRVKQRPDTQDDRGIRGREWHNLCVAVTGCILAYGRPLRLTMKGGDANHVFNINSAQAARGYHVSAGVSLKLHLAKSIVQQAFHASVSPTWVPISARTSSMVVQAIISTESSPQKHVQFICIGNRYVPIEDSCGMLYESINRVFWNSSFGQANDDLQDQDKMKGRLHKARPNFKHWPMFVILVKWNRTDSAKNICKQDLVNKVDSIVTELATRFLEEHHYRPRKPLMIRNKTDVTSRDTDFSVIETSRTASRSAITSSKEALPKQFSPSDDAFSRSEFEVKFPTEQVRQPVVIHKDDALFRSQFISSRNILPRESGARTSLVSNEMRVHKEAVSEPILQESKTNSLQYDTVGYELESDHPENEDHHSQSARSECYKDKYINWTDPRTRQTFRMNARTGFVIKPKDSQRPATEDDSISQLAPSRPRQSTLPRLLRSSDGIVPPRDGSWAQKFFQSWHNPVFETTETRLSTTRPDSQHFDVPSLCKHSYMSSTDAPEDLIAQATLRLSKTRLQEATAISQVDTKFILVRIPSLQNESLDDMVVLVDQHAADERIRVEKLLEDLCSVPNQDISSFVSPLNQKSAVNTVILEQPLVCQLRSQERDLFERVAPFFSQWGILYDSKLPTNPQEPHQLMVLSLPDCIAQRCKLEPKLLHNLLRSEAWKHEQEPSNLDQNPSADVNWVTKIRTCPSGILDLINSRACRSAIMFNDVLMIDQCRKLISDLAKCQFPFQCAHGRPSMVPLLGLGGDNDTAGISCLKDDFVDAWKTWTNE